MSGADIGRALAVVLIWGSNFVVMKWGLADLSPMLLGALRFGCASLPFVIFMPRPAMPWHWLAGYGLAQGLGQFGLLFVALSLGMTAGMASVVMQSQAMFTMLLAAPLLGERARPMQWLGLAVSALGLATIGLSHGDGPGEMSLVGFVLTLGAGLMWAISNLIVRFASQRAPGYDPLAFIAWSSLAPVLPFAALALGFGGSAQVLRQLGAITLPTAGAVLYLALLATLLAYALWTRLLQRHAAARVVPFSLLVPVIGLAAGAVAFGERPGLGQWAGTAAVLAGLAINQWGSARRPWPFSANKDRTCASA